MLPQGCVTHSHIPTVISSQAIQELCQLIIFLEWCLLKKKKKSKEENNQKAHAGLVKAGA